VGEGTGESLLIRRYEHEEILADARAAVPPRGFLVAVAADDYCYLTTVGRRTGRRHRIEIWYARHGDTLYLLSGGGERADWVRNIRARPGVSVELEGATREATGRVVRGGREDELARQLVFDKYHPRYEGDLSAWRARALPVALDLSPRSQP
jgi:deazaflavin-dependent oxidoreductase (nitroreductase family)